MCYLQRSTQMARFRATIQGTRGSASRLGHASLMAVVNGWTQGVTVHAFKLGNNERFIVVKTGGSNGLSTMGQVIARIENGNIVAQFSETVGK